MKTRLLSAAILLPVLFLVIWVLPTIVTAILVGVMAALAAYELLHNADLLHHKRLLIYCMVAAMAVSLWSYWDAPREWGLLGVLVFLGVLFGEMMHNRVKVRFEKICLCLTVGILMPYMLTALVRILGTYMGRYTIIIPFILAFLPDSGAYFAGTYLGRHKLAPVISPNKTVEGALGGAVTAVFGMMLYALIMDVAFGRTVNYWIALLYGVLGAGVDIFGDLMFSVIKRQTGIKDYGNLIPGHGGILDRFDSMMMVAPFVEILLILIPVVK